MLCSNLLWPTQAAGAAGEQQQEHDGRAAPARVQPAGREQASGSGQSQPGR